jgi:uncharacterized iron-regulated protein
MHDPLIEQIYSSSAPDMINFNELLRVMQDSDVIYLGEDHDNIHHHRIQLDIIRALVEKGLKPAIGFEFFSRQQTSHLLRHQNSADRFHQPDSEHSAEKLLRMQLGWAKNRDGDWNHLYPILQYAREHKLPVFGADLSPVLRKQLTKGGYEGLSPVEKLFVTQSPFSDSDYQEFMYQSFTRAHCGWGDEIYLQKLYSTWLARNEAMAESIVAMHRSSPAQPVVMILGGAHTQYNMAVFERTLNLVPDIRQLNLRLQSVAQQPLPVADYFEPMIVNEQSFGSPYEYLWFTARMPEREDPCKAFLKYKNKHSKSHKTAG